MKGIEAREKEGVNVKYFTEISIVKYYYTNLPRLIQLIENILLLTKYFIAKYYKM